MFDLKISRRLSVIGLGLLFAAASGCVRETTEQGEHVFQYELWVPGSILLGGIVAAVAGFFLRKWNTRGWMGAADPGAVRGLSALGRRCFSTARPSSKDGFELRTGIYGQTVVPRVQFDGYQPDSHHVRDPKNPPRGQEHQLLSQLRQEVRRLGESVGEQQRE